MATKSKPRTSNQVLRGKKANKSKSYIYILPGDKVRQMLKAKQRRLDRPHVIDFVPSDSLVDMLMTDSGNFPKGRVLAVNVRFLLDFF